MSKRKLQEEVSSCLKKVKLYDTDKNFNLEIERWYVVLQNVVQFFIRKKSTDKKLRKFIMKKKQTVIHDPYTELVQIRLRKNFYNTIQVLKFFKIQKVSPEKVHSKLL
jgi:hypothetical protein